MVTFGGTDVVNAARVGGVCAGFAPPSETSTDEAIDGLELKDLPRFGARVKILQSTVVTKIHKVSFFVQSS